VKRTITVLRDDIDNGERRHSNWCAIARAASRDLADLMEEGDQIGVGSAVSIWIAGGCESRLSAELPEKVKTFVNDFDNGCEVEPFKFEVELKESAEDTVL
jgi:hypothetical protein